MRHNLSIGVEEIRFNNYIYVQDNQIKGPFASILNNYYGLNTKK